MFVAGVELHLTPTEYRLLVLLAENAGRVLTHRHILSHVWGPTHSGHSHYVRVRWPSCARKDSPHGMQQVWYSANIRELVELPSFAAPEGTVAIKRFDMEGDGTDDGLAVMIKKPAGYDPANNDWYYDMRMLDGSIMPEPPAGKIQMCIDCHKGSTATDYLSGTKVN